MKILKYFDYICELFDSSTYKWTNKNEFDCVEAIFTLNNREYVVQLKNLKGLNDDVKMDNKLYSLIFFFKDGKNNKFKLIKNSKTPSIKVFSNVKHIVEDFWNEFEPHFIGFHSRNSESEREILYEQFLKSLEKPGYITEVKRMKKKTYYFIYREEL